MRISVVTPTKDRPEAVELCQRWFSEQRYPVYEHIVVDGGGMLDNLREGIRKAKGDIVLLADDDDYYDPGWTKWVAGTYRDPESQAAGQTVQTFYHIRGARRWDGEKQGPLAGTISFRIGQSDNVIQWMDEDGRPKRILRDVKHTVVHEQFCCRIMGLYLGDGPGRGLSRKHSPDSFPIPDPGLRSLRERIGDSAVDAYLDAVKRIDERLKAAV